MFINNTDTLAVAITKLQSKAIIIIGATAILFGFRNNQKKTLLENLC